MFPPWVSWLISCRNREIRPYTCAAAFRAFRMYRALATEPVPDRILSRVLQLPDKVPRRCAA
jgi:hypothetical protein